MTQEKDESAAASLSVIPEDSAESLPESPTLPLCSQLRAKLRSSENGEAHSVRSTIRTSTRSAGSTPLTALEAEWEGLRASEYVAKQPCSCACALF